MKKVILSVAIIATMGLTSFANESNKNVEVVEIITVDKTEITFGVRGNCGMCKKTIEKAANAVDGVTSAEWDKDKKEIVVSFDDSKTNEMAIHKAIAASGYDTDKVSSKEESYKKLPGCCQYDQEMKIGKSEKGDN